MDRKELEWEGVYRIRLAQDRDQLQTRYHEHGNETCSQVACRLSSCENETTCA
jgi:hypothetical protein